MIAKLFAALATLIAAFALGFHTHQLLIEKERVAELQSHIELKDKQNDISNAADASHAATQREIEVITKTIIKEVPIYVTKNDDVRCIINTGAIRLHNNAAGGTVPDPTSEPDAGPAGPAANKN